MADVGLLVGARAHGHPDDREALFLGGGEQGRQFMRGDKV